MFPRDYSQTWDQGLVRFWGLWVYLRTWDSDLAQNFHTFFFKSMRLMQLVLEISTWSDKTMVHEARDCIATLRMLHCPLWRIWCWALTSCLCQSLNYFLCIWKMYHKLQGIPLFLFAYHALAHLDVGHGHVFLRMAKKNSNIQGVAATKGGNLVWKSGHMHVGSLL